VIRLAVAVASATLLLTGAAQAQQPGIMEPGDQAELAQSLADAQAEQGVCYGWDVELNGARVDVGSSTGGPGTPLSTAECPKWAVLTAVIRWTCESCEEEDSAYFEVDSNLDDPPTRQDVLDLGYSDADLVGDEDDTTLFEMTGALPLLAAQRGNADPVPFETPGEVAAADRPEGSPGSDFLRTKWPQLLLCVGLIALGPGYLIFARHNRPR
jgi:hypothetical protein